MTKLAPPRFVGQVMGLWFLALALGNNLAGQLSGEYDAANLTLCPGCSPRSADCIRIMTTAAPGGAAIGGGARMRRRLV